MINNLYLQSLHSSSMHLCTDLTTRWIHWSHGEMNPHPSQRSSSVVQSYSRDGMLQFNNRWRKKMNNTHKKEKIVWFYLLKIFFCIKHPLELRCAQPGERLQEERQPGAPCHVSSDEDYCMECCCKWLWDNLKLKTPQLHKVYSRCYSMIASARVLSNGGVLAGNKLKSGSMGGTHCYVRPPLKKLDK